MQTCNFPFSNPLPSSPQSGPDSWRRWHDFRRITASTGGRDTPKSWVLSGKHMMMGPACFSESRCPCCDTRVSFVDLYFWVFYGVSPFRSCGSGIAMTGADDAHGNVLLTPYIHSVHGKKCVYVHLMVSFVLSILCGDCIPSDGRPE